MNKDVDEKYIYYNNINKEENALFKIGTKLFLVHLIVRNKDEYDYLVVGEIQANNLITKENYQSWLLQFDRVIHSFQEPVKSNLTHEEALRIRGNMNYNNLNYLRFLPLTSAIKFTREGYDLLINKSQFTNNKISRTAKIDIEDISKEHGIMFGNNITSNQGIFENDTFKPIEELEQTHFLTQEELLNTDLDKMRQFIIFSKKRLEQILSTSKDNFKELYYYENVYENQLVYLMAFLDAKMEALKYDNKTPKQIIDSVRKPNEMTPEEIEERLKRIGFSDKQLEDKFSQLFEENLKKLEDNIKENEANKTNGFRL